VWALWSANTVFMGFLGVLS